MQGTLCLPLREAEPIILGTWIPEFSSELPGPVQVQGQPVVGVGSTPHGLSHCVHSGKDPWQRPSLPKPAPKVPGHRKERFVPWLVTVILITTDQYVVH